MRTLTAPAALLASFIATAPTVLAEQSGPAGGGQPVSNTQPSLALSFTISEFGIYGLGVPVRMFAIDLPQDWMTPDGRVLIKAQHQYLFDQLHAAYGGDGVTTFALPDLRGRTPIGSGAGPDLPSYLPAQVAGQDQVSLSVSQMPLHTHEFGCNQQTSAAGGSDTFDNVQPSLAMYYTIATQGAFPSRGLATRGGVGNPGLPFYAQVFLNAAPTVNANGLLPADGRLLSVFQNQALFSLIFDLYGGDARNTLGLPDLRGRAALDYGQGAGLANINQGTRLGTADTQLNVFQMPAHSHGVPGRPDTQVAGGNLPVDNHQPSLAINYCICTLGVYPSGPGADDQSTYLGEIIMFAGTFAPQGFQPCDGRYLPVSGNEALALLMGTRYGGDGVNTIRLPDLRGRIPVCAGPELPVGTFMGTENADLTVANLPTHTHHLPADCVGDFNGDGRRDTADLVLMLANFGFTLAPGTCTDINRDGVVSTPDLTAFLATFGQNCP